MKPLKPLPRKRGSNPGSPGEVFTHCVRCGAVLTREYHQLCSPTCAHLHLNEISGFNAWRRDRPAPETTMKGNRRG